jgi:hypothetical protein
MALLRLGGSLLVVGAAGCAYEAPRNPNADPLLNAVVGTVVFAGDGELAPTYVTVYDAANPPPPVGTGAPTTFTAIPTAAYSDPAAGLPAAGYAITRLPDGTWLLNALLDTDGDFNPFTSVLAGATCGDWGGAHLADLAGTPAPVPVSGGQAFDDVTILIGQEFPLERPVFELGTDEVSLSAVVGGTVAPFVRLRSSAVASAFSEDLPVQLGPSCAPAAEPPCDAASPTCPCDPASMAPCGTALWVELRDADGDGVVDPYPAEPQASSGLLDVWPRVFLEYVGEPLDTFEYQGRELPERWVSQAHPLAGEILGAAGQAGLPPGEAAALLGPVGAPFPVAELSVTFLPVFLHYHAGGAMGVDVNGPFDLVDLTVVPTAPVPTGAWAVTVVSFTGQTWTLPNDVGLLGLPSFDPGLEPALQGQPLVLAP